MSLNSRNNIAATSSDADSPKSLEALLRSRLSRFLVEEASWKEPLREMIDMLRHSGWPAVIFGGVLRDLVLYGPAERPRDVDIVVKCSSAALSKWLAPFTSQRTRFGGFRVRLYKWTFDIWSLNATWGFKAGHMRPTFENLPKTTFFNIEGIAAELNTPRQHKRELYSSGFSDAIRSRILDINFEPNPFPQLCIIRGLLTAARHDLMISPRLARYMIRQGNRSEIVAIVDAQSKHYGIVRLRPRDIERWLDHIALNLELNEEAPVKLPITPPEQLELPVSEAFESR